MLTTLVIVFFSGWNVFLARKKGEKFDHATLITNYLPMLFVPFLYVGYKLKYKTKILGYEDMDCRCSTSIIADMQSTPELVSRVTSSKRSASVPPRTSSCVVSALPFFK
jgi:amino acid permease